LPGGARLKPELIAAELGVSRMPVREAIRQLDAEGYVTIRPNRGAVVTARGREQVVELFEIRAALEGLALRLAAARADAEMLADLEIDLRRLRNVGEDSARWLERHDEFHDRLCRAANRPQLEAECRRYRLAVRPYVRVYLKTGRTFEQPGFGHEALIEALRAADGEAAEAAARAHIMANAQAIADCLPDRQEQPSASAA
jgi:DNA-binding GntR family transcriptional regulator